MRKSTFDFVDTDDAKNSCRQGETFRRNIRFQDKHGNLIPLLGGWTARMQARESVTSTDVLFDLTTENDGLAINEDGVLQIYISHTDTSEFAVGKYKYDIELVAPSGDVGSPLSGKFQVTPEITRD